METSSTSRDTVAATTPVAMYAIARHMLDHRLPAPLSIDAPTWDDRRVQIRLAARDLDEWLEWCVIDTEAARPGVTGWETVTFTGRMRVAIGEVAVSIKVARRSTALTSVRGGAA